MIPRAEHAWPYNPSDYLLERPVSCSLDLETALVFVYMVFSIFLGNLVL